VTNPHNPPASGKSCRTASASFAASPGEQFFRERCRRVHRTGPLFAQFPPAALFTAIGRAAARGAVAPL